MPSGHGRDAKHGVESRGDQPTVDATGRPLVGNPIANVGYDTPFTGLADHDGRCERIGEPKNGMTDQQLGGAFGCRRKSSCAGVRLELERDALDRRYGRLDEFAWGVGGGHGGSNSAQYVREASQFGPGRVGSDQECFAD
jgi:hypothetical protein